MLEIKVKKTLEKKNKEQKGFLLDVNCDIKEGSFAALKGESGAGKSTLLRILAGLSTPDEGILKWKEEDWFNHQKRKNLSPGKRKIGMVFQDYSLFPNMSVRKNLDFAANSKGDEIQSWISKLLRISGLEIFSHRKPHQLSGGQKQRVALIRALVNKPGLLLLDEPLSALDPWWRTQLQNEILKMHKDFNLTTVLVSHDMQEVVKMAEEVFLMHEGKVVKSGNPSEIWMKGKLSSKVRFSGLVMDIKKDGLLTVLMIQSEEEIIKVVSLPDEVSNINVGDRVMVATKAFNPIVVKEPEDNHEAFYLN